MPCRYINQYLSVDFSHLADCDFLTTMLSGFASCCASGVYVMNFGHDPAV